MRNHTVLSKKEFINEKHANRTVEIKALVKSNYTKIPHIIFEEVFEDNLSKDALLVLIYLWCQSEGYIIYNSVISEKFKMSKNKVIKVFAELSESGYVTSRRVGNKSYEYTLVRFSTITPVTVVEKDEVSPKEEVKVYTKDEVLEKIKPHCKMDNKVWIRVISFMKKKRKENYTSHDLSYIGYIVDQETQSYWKNKTYEQYKME